MSASEDDAEAEVEYIYIFSIRARFIWRLLYNIW